MKPKVSVLLITYNHSKYIKRAIESILMQKTDFTYELVIGDDYSPDQTREFIEHCLVNTEISVKRLYPDKNKGAKQNIYHSFMECRGEYIAYMEGDDFWTDEMKLQKQVDFLENNPDYVEVAHQCAKVDQNDHIVEKVYRTFNLNKEYTFVEYSQFKLPGQSSTLMLKNFGKELFEEIRKLGKIKYCPLDRIMQLIYLKKGKIYTMDDVMSAYRYDLSADSNSWSAKIEGGKVENYLYFFFMSRELDRIAKKLGYETNYTFVRKQYFGKAVYMGKKQRNYRYYLMCFLMLLFAKHKRSFYRGGMEMYGREVKKEMQQK